MFLKGVQSLPEIAAQLMVGGWAPDTPVAVIQQGTLPGQAVVTGTLADIAGKARGLLPQAVICVIL